jgi:hypothetical protein
LYHASPIANKASIRTHGLRAGADGFVHLATDALIALYCVHIRKHSYRKHSYQRDAPTVIFRVNAARIQVQPCPPDALFAADCFVHAGDIPKEKVHYIMTTQVQRWRH